MVFWHTQSTLLLCFWRNGMHNVTLIVYGVLGICTQTACSDLQLLMIPSAGILLNSLRSSDAYMRQLTNHHWFRWWLVAWTAPSHYLNQYWNIVNWTLRNKLQWNFNRDSHIFIQENALVNVGKMVAILSLPQCVKTQAAAWGQYLHTTINKSMWYQTKIKIPASCYTEGVGPWINSYFNVSTQTRVSQLVMAGEAGSL